MATKEAFVKKTEQFDTGFIDTIALHDTGNNTDLFEASAMKLATDMQLVEK